MISIYSYSKEIPCMDDYDIFTDIEVRKNGKILYYRDRDRVKMDVLTLSI